MERVKEFALVKEALDKGSIPKVNVACRQVLLERTKGILCTDKEVRGVVEELISGYSPCVEVSVVEQHKSIPMQVSKNHKVLCGVMGFVGLLAASFSLNFPVSAMEKMASQPFLEFNVLGLSGCVALIIAAVWGANLWMQSQSKSDTTYKCVIKQRVEDIIRELDAVSDSLKNLLLHNQLERQYSPLLQWIQVLWAEGDKGLQKDVCKILDRIDYELVDYSPGVAEYFDANKATGIDEPQTTRPALRNKLTKEIVERGYVIVPM